MEQSVSEMLKLIEEGGDSFAEKAERYHQKRPELVAHVEEFYRMYQSLAEHCDRLTELIKSNPSALQTPDSDYSEPTSGQASLLLTPDQKLGVDKSSHQAVDVDSPFISSNGGSELSSKEGVESSSASSSSDSESESFDSIKSSLGKSPDGGSKRLHQKIIKLEASMKEKVQVAKDKYANYMLKLGTGASYEELLERNTEYEKELKISNLKLQFSEEEIAKLKCELANNESATRDLQAQLESAQKEIEKELKISNLKLQFSEEEIAQLKCELVNNESATRDLQAQLESAQKEIETWGVNLDLEKRLVLDLRKQIVELENHVSESDNKICMLEEELEVTRKNLQESGEENERTRHELTNDISEVNSRLQVQHELVAMLETRLQANIAEQMDSESNHDHEVKELNTMLRTAQESFFHEKTQLQSEISTLSEQQILLEARLEEWKSQSQLLHDEVKRCKANEMEMKSLHESQENGLQGEIELLKGEKTQLQSEISSLSEQQVLLEARLEEWKSQSQSLEDEVRQCKGKEIEMKTLHEAKENDLQGEIEWLKAELSERGDVVKALKENLDALQLTYDTLMAEKDELSTRVDTLIADVNSWDNQVQELEDHLCQLRQERVELIAGSERAKLLVEKLSLRVEELEREVDRQSAVILDGAEKKREAIRQLCFSIEHYRSGYQELRQAFIGHKRPAVLAS